MAPSFWLPVAQSPGPQFLPPAAGIPLQAKGDALALGSEHPGDERDQHCNPLPPPCRQSVQSDPPQEERRSTRQDTGDALQVAGPKVGGPKVLIPGLFAIGLLHGNAILTLSVLKAAG